MLKKFSAPWPNLPMEVSFLGENSKVSAKSGEVSSGEQSDIPVDAAMDERAAAGIGGEVASFYSIQTDGGRTEDPVFRLCLCCRVHDS